jgi:hypothetical protein
MKFWIAREDHSRQAAGRRDAESIRIGDHS